MKINDEKIEMSNEEVIDFTLKTAVSLNIINDEKAKEYKEMYKKSNKFSQKMVASVFFENGITKFIELIYSAYKKGAFTEAINFNAKISDIFSEIFKKEDK